MTSPPATTTARDFGIVAEQQLCDNGTFSSACFSNTYNVGMIESKLPIAMPTNAMTVQ